MEVGGNPMEKPYGKGKMDTGGYLENKNFEFPSLYSPLGRFSLFSSAFHRVIVLSIGFSKAFHRDDCGVHTYGTFSIGMEEIVWKISYGKPYGNPMESPGISSVFRTCVLPIASLWKGVWKTLWKNTRICSIPKITLCWPYGT